MPQEPVPPDPAPEWRLVPSSPDWPECWDDEAFLAVADEEPGDPDEYEDPDNAPPPGLDNAQQAALIREAREFSARQADAAAQRARSSHSGTMEAIGSFLTGRRGPDMPGSA